MEGPRGTIQGKSKKISQLTVRVERTRGLLVGPSFTALVEQRQRTTEVFGAPTQLLTGDFAQTLTSQWDTGGRIAIRQRYPLPMTILAVIPDVTIGD